MTIHLEKATPADVEQLTATQIRAFDEDVRRYPDAPPGGPPGYDDAAWQLDRMQRGHYFKLVEDGVVVGGALVFRTGPASCELGRIWVDPPRQGRGIGGRAMELLERAFPEATVWTLDTPAWARRNHTFYGHRGYRKLREEDVGRMVLFFYEKRLGGSAQPQRGAP